MKIERRKIGKALIFAVFFAMLIFVSVGCASAATHYVNPGESIQAVVTAANAGDTIIVRDGTYTENIDINKRLTIQSENGSASTIAQAANPDDHVFEVTADYVNISGFTVEGANEYETPAPAGIYLYYVNYCNIFDNNLSNNYNGIRLFGSGNNKLANNTALNNKDSGILLEDTSDNNLVMNNNLKNNYLGICLRCWGADNNTIVNNNIESNYRCGMTIACSINNVITNNNIKDNHYAGVHFYSSNNTIRNNNISNNWHYAITFSHRSDDNIYLNNFINNNDVYDEYGDSSYTWNSPEEITYTYNGSEFENYLGNYWDDYVFAGNDTDGDGIGDTPYSIDSDKDNYPLVEEFENYIAPPPEGLLNVPFFSQRDPAWSDKKLDHSPYSIGEYGCALTSAAMVSKYFGYDTDPDRLNTSLTEVGGLDTSGILHWKKVEEVSDGKVEWVGWGEGSWSRIDQELSEKNPVIANVSCPLGTHFIVFIGKVGDGHYLVQI